MLFRNTPQKALDLCESFHGASTVLWTKHAAGLMAVRAPAIEAVIWPKQYQDNTSYAKVMDSLLDGDSVNLEAYRRVLQYFGTPAQPFIRCSKRTIGLLEDFGATRDVLLEKSLRKWGRLATEVTGHKVGYLAHYMKFDDWRDFKVLRDIFNDRIYKDGFTMHSDLRPDYVLYKNSSKAGIELVAQDITQMQRKEITSSKPSDRNALKSIYNIVQLGPHDVMAFSADGAVRRGEHKFGLVHGSPLPVAGTYRVGFFVDSGRNIGVA